MAPATRTAPSSSAPTVFGRRVAATAPARRTLAGAWMIAACFTSVHHASALEGPALPPQVLDELQQIAALRAERSAGCDTVGTQRLTRSALGNLIDVSGAEHFRERWTIEVCGTRQHFVLLWHRDAGNVLRYRLEDLGRTSPPKVGSRLRLEQTRAIVESIGLDLRATTRCSVVHLAGREVTELPSPADDPLATHERWTIFACGQRYRYIVKVSGDDRVRLIQPEP